MTTDTDRLTEILEDLDIILNEMNDHIGEVDALVREAATLRDEPIIYDRAKGYWMAQIKMAVSDDHDYIGGASITFADTISELRYGEDGDDSEGGAE